MKICISQNINENDKQLKTILVTGGAGYIGCNVVQKLASKGNKVIVVDNLSNSYENGILELKEKYPQIRFYNFDLLDNDKLENLFINEKIDSVIHLAGKKYVGESFVNETEYYNNNVILTKNLLDLMTKYAIKHLVFSSSITVYGATNKTIVDEETQKQPLSPYAKQKSECEEIIKQWSIETNSQVIILRLSNPIGANTEYFLGDNPKTKQYMGILPSFISKIKNNEYFKLNGGDHPTKDGSTVRDYIHVTDVANAFVSASNSNIQGFSIMNIGSGGNGYSVLDILHTIEQNLKAKANFSFGPRREGDVSIFISNNEKAKRLLNFNVTKNLNDMVSSQIEFTNKIENNNLQNTLQ